ncbi:MAG: N-acetylmuramoyl-L-alanine amidase [Deltaproteobacteria bacterium]|nr:N-acetylmuramoyl-L-alanine amidase [Deltaproteobacteria bacterium]
MITRSRNIVRALIILTWLVPLSAGAAGHMVVIDPAHGGDDGGVKLSRSTYEKDITLAVARMMKKNLSGTDMEVRLTRSDDRDVSPAERKKVSEESDADLFISLHINAAFGQKAGGYELYYLGITAPSSKTNDPGEILKDMEQTKRLNSSVLFAQIVQKNMGEIFPRRGRGLRDAPVRILQSLSAPAILLEMGFSTEIEDRRKLRDPDIQKAVADMLSRSVKEYFLTGGAS